jgi:hypothetical protein
MNEQSNLPEQPANSQPSTAPTAQPQPGPLFPAAKNPLHKEKKTVKEYLFEFVLVFTAVVLGFMADSFRENLEDHQKEKKYMRSLISDVNGDYTLARELDAALLQQVKKIDSLQQVLSSPELLFNQDSIVRCYQLSSSILTFYPEFFNERTTNQLLSSGSMRLINNQDIADSIMAYHSFIKFLDVQRELYINSISSCSNSMYDIYDISYLRTSLGDDNVLYYVPVDMASMKLRTNRPDDIKKFVATLEHSKLVASNYRSIMQNMAAHADRLYTYLSKAYD